MNLKITSRGSIMSCNPRELLRGGYVLSLDEAKSRFGGMEEVDRLVGQGFLIKTGDQLDRDEHPLPPGVNPAPPMIPPDIDTTKGDKEIVDLGSPTKLLSTVRTTSVTSRSNPWGFSPAALEGKDVSELNVMISERTRSGYEAKQFETCEEAVAWLSQDYEQDTKVTTEESAPAQ